MYESDDDIMISALQHYAFCPRQFALIHLEQYWHENFYTVDGKNRHRRVELPGVRHAGKRKVEYALPISSSSLGIYGVADAVEFLGSGDSMTAVPVEYKRGREKDDDCDRLQLCAQVLCLEEMTGRNIPEAWLFYFETRTRVAVQVSKDIRLKCQSVITACREVFRSGVTPHALYEHKKCRNCSLVEYCMPTPDAPASFLHDFKELMQ